MMSASTEQLRAKYVETGLADDADIEGYHRFASDPDAWGIYYATVRVLAPACDAVQRRARSLPHE